MGCEFVRKLRTLGLDLNLRLRLDTHGNAVCMLDAVERACYAASTSRNKVRRKGGLPCGQ